MPIQNSGSLGRGKPMKKKLIENKVKELIDNLGLPFGCGDLTYNPSEITQKSQVKTGSFLIFTLSPLTRLYSHVTMSLIRVF